MDSATIVVLGSTGTIQNDKRIVYGLGISIPNYIMRKFNRVLYVSTGLFLLLRI